MLSIAWWHFQWPWQTPNTVFKVTAVLKSNISKTVRFRDNVTITLIGNHTQSFEWCHIQWPWVTSDPDFKVPTFFEVEHRKKGASYWQSYYCKRGKVPNIGLWNGTWPWLTSKRVAPVCQHQLSLLYYHLRADLGTIRCTASFLPSLHVSVHSFPTPCLKLPTTHVSSIGNILLSKETRTAI